MTTEEQARALASEVDTLRALLERHQEALGRQIQVGFANETQRQLYADTQSYTFVKDLSTPQWTVKIDTDWNYGYFERCRDGEGGGLWFSRNDDNGEIELIDYDGMAALPASMVKVLRDAGYYLDETHD